jgi:hypothetical protein
MLGFSESNYKKLQVWFSHGQVIGNVDMFLHHTKPSKTFAVARSQSRQKRRKYSQFQQGAVGIAVSKLLLALLAQVALEMADSLGVVPLEAVDDACDVLGPLGRVFAVHGGGRKGEWFEGDVGGKSINKDFYGCVRGAACGFQMGLASKGGW